MSIYKAEVEILKSRALQNMNENQELINAGQAISWEFFSQDARVYFDCDEFIRNSDEAVKDDELIGRLSVALGKQRIARVAVGVKSDLDKVTKVIGDKAKEGIKDGFRWLGKIATSASENIK